MPKISPLFAALFLFFAGMLPAQQAVDATAQSAVTSTAQHAVDPTQGMHRFICLVHLQGQGTVSDPMRPEYAPQSSAASAAAVSRSGIIAWSFQLTDDGTMAIVHFVAPNRSAFAPILADTRPEIRVFEVGVNTQAEIEAEMRKYKANFSLDTLKVAAR